MFELLASANVGIGLRTKLCSLDSVEDARKWDLDRLLEQHSRSRHLLVVKQRDDVMQITRLISDQAGACKYAVDIPCFSALCAWKGFFGPQPG